MQPLHKDHLHNKDMAPIEAKETKSKKSKEPATIAVVKQSPHATIDSLKNNRIESLW